MIVLDEIFSVRVFDSVSGSWPGGGDVRCIQDVVDTNVQSSDTCLLLLHDCLSLQNLASLRWKSVSGCLLGSPFLQPMVVLSVFGGITDLSSQSLGILVQN
jgi:hypothetical protein